jgi:beta-glucanase (GH16 family)
MAVHMGRAAVIGATLVAAVATLAASSATAETAASCWLSAHIRLSHPLTGRRILGTFAVIGRPSTTCSGARSAELARQLDHVVIRGSYRASGGSSPSHACRLTYSQRGRLTGGASRLNPLRLVLTGRQAASGISFSYHGRGSFRPDRVNACPRSAIRSGTFAGRLTVSDLSVGTAVASPAPTAAPAPAKPLPTGCSGEALLPKPDGSRWVCAFDDEFDATTGDATALNRSWWAPQVSATSGFTTGPPADYVCYVDSPDNISVSGGALHLTVRQEPQPLSCGPFHTQYTGGMVSTYYGFHQTYGRFEIRALLPQTTVAGLDEALWMWPVNDTLYGSWPGSGEIDIAEFFSTHPTVAVPWIHYNFDSSLVDPATHTNTYNALCQISPTQYNDYVLTWSPGNFTVSINGTTCLDDNYAPDGGLTSPQPFDQPFFIALTQGLDNPAFDPATTPLPATLSVDYVRVWK